MRLSHVYQPLVISCLVQVGGAATLDELAASFLLGDERVLDYYVDRIRQMPVPVLANHGIVERRGDVVRLTTGPLTGEQRRRVEALCRKHLESFLEQRGFTYDSTPELLRWQATSALERAARRSPYPPTGPDGPLPFPPVRTVRGCRFCSPYVKARAIARNRLAYAVGHLRSNDPREVMVVPYRHTPDIFGMTTDERRHADELLVKMRESLRDRFPEVKVFDIVTRTGGGSGHAHILLRARA